MLNNFSNKRAISKAILGQLTLDQGNIRNISLWKFNYKDLEFEQFTFWAMISDFGRDSLGAGCVAFLLFFWTWPLLFLFGNRWIVRGWGELSRRDSFKLSLLCRKLWKERKEEEEIRKNKATLRKMGFDV